MSRQEPLSFRAATALVEASMIMPRVDPPRPFDLAPSAKPMPPTIVLLYGNLKGGTPVVIAAPDAAADGGVIVAFHPIASLL